MNIALEGANLITVALLEAQQVVADQAEEQ
jgi:hypothetical protein